METSDHAKEMLQRIEKELKDLRLQQTDKIGYMIGKYENLIEELIRLNIMLINYIVACEDKIKCNKA